MASSPDLTLGDLVQNSALGLTVLVAGDLTARVRGAHAMEISRPQRWLEPGWLLLTTGLRFIDNDDASGQAELIRGLKNGNAAGLAFGVGVNFEQVPLALVNAAAEVGLTLLAVAAEVPFTAVESYVNRSLAAPEAYVAKRALWIQTELLQSLSAEQPLTALVNQIGQLIKGIAVIYDDGGATIASTGAVPAHLIWEQIRLQAGLHPRFTVGRWQVATRPTAIEGLTSGSPSAHNRRMSSTTSQTRCSARCNSCSGRYSHPPPSKRPKPARRPTLCSPCSPASSRRPKPRPCGSGWPPSASESTPPVRFRVGQAGRPSG